MSGPRDARTRPTIVRLPMHDGWEYVVAAYAVAGVTLGVWFAMIGTKLRRQRAARSTPVERSDG
jgi:hypothetical protein